MTEDGCAANQDQGGGAKDSGLRIICPSIWPTRRTCVANLKYLLPKSECCLVDTKLTKRVDAQAGTSETCTPVVLRACFAWSSA